MRRNENTKVALDRLTRIFAGTDAVVYEREHGSILTYARCEAMVCVEIPSGVQIDITPMKQGLPWSVGITSLTDNDYSDFSLEIEENFQTLDEALDFALSTVETKLFEGLAVIRRAISANQQKQEVCGGS